jgi:hypothetical protein
MAVLTALRELHVERLKLEIVQNEQVRAGCFQYAATSSEQFLGTLAGMERPSVT